MEKQLKRSRSFGTQCAVSSAALAARLPWIVEMLSPSMLTPAKRNARAHNKAQEEAVANSLTHFGVIKPVVIDEQGRIVAGHVVWHAAKRLGLKRIPVIRVSHLSETELRAYALADNQLATKSAWDLEILSLELGELELALPEIGLDLSITGFEPAEVDAVFDSIGADVANPADEAPELSEGPVPSENLIRHVTGLHLQRKHWWWGRTRQTDLCSEHAPRPVSFRACGGASAQLWHPDQEVNSWIPPTTGLPRTPATNPAPTRRDCPRGQRSRLPRMAPAPMNYAANGGGFTAVSRQGSVATC